MGLIGGRVFGRGRAACEIRFGETKVESREFLRRDLSIRDIIASLTMIVACY